MNEANEFEWFSTSCDLKKIYAGPEDFISFEYFRVIMEAFLHQAKGAFKIPGHYEFRLGIKKIEGNSVVDNETRVE